MRILMCPPEYYDVTYKINPWMTREKEVDKQRATKQWQKLRQQIEQCGAKVVLVPPQKNLPISAFFVRKSFLGSASRLGQF